MKKLLLITALLACMGSLARAEDPDDDPAQGLTPAMMNQWNRAQFEYSKSITQYGKDSPEATQAQVEMNTLARKFGIKPPDALPESTPLDKAETPDESDLQPAKEVLSEAEVKLKDKTPKSGSQAINDLTPDAFPTSEPPQQTQ